MDHERVVCWCVAVGMGILLLIGPIAAAISNEAEFHPLQIIVPLVLIPLAVARLKGWVKQGSGGGP